MAGELTLSGITGANFDGGAIVDTLMQLKALPIQRLQQEKALVQAKLSSLGNLSGAVSDFYGIFEGLIVDDLFKGKKASVSDEDVLGVSVSEDAPEIEFSVTVNKLSQVEIRVTNQGVSSLDTGFSSSGTLTISYNLGGSTETFSVDYSAGQTIEDLVNSINQAQDRVKASVYYDGNSYRLMLSEVDVSASDVETDTANGVYVITVSGLPSELGSGLDTIQEAKNAEIVIGSGSPITSPSNTFENVISGVTITVSKTGTASVSISDDFSKVSGFLSKFVKYFNATVEVSDSLTTGENPLFAGDGTIRGVKTGITERLEPLIDLGLIEYNGETGKISLKNDRLNELLESDPDSVRSMIEQLKDSYGSFLELQKDVFKSFEDNFNDRIEAIDTRIEQLRIRLAQEERILRLEYARLEAFIAQANEIRERLQQFIVTLSQMTGGGKES
jgi:flagellar hook-associated protein 2